MWFRLSSSGQQATIEPTIPPTMATPISSNTLYVPTTTTCGEKLDKFRMGSFKKKNEQRQRSKSPLWYKSCSVEEEFAVDKHAENAVVESTLDDRLNKKSTEASSENALLLPLIVCDPKGKQTKKTLRGIKTDPPKRKFYKNFTSSKSHEESEPEKEKEKVLLTDRKFKNNRIEKSSSKTKINAGVAGVGDLEKRESIKRSARKISAPPVLSDIGKKSFASSLNDEKSYACLSDSEPPKKSNVRAHSNLNLHALVKLVSNKKFLSSEDFALIRRKSLSEAASSVIAIAANHCKPLPIALKCSTDGTVAKDVSNGNVVLARHDLKGSFCDRLNNVNINNNNCSNKNNIKKRCSTSSNGSIKSTDSMRRRESDEEFYSCDDDAAAAVVFAGSAAVSKDATKDVKRKSSPSLTSRVAAKITETTNNYKNRKANKTPKKKKKTTVNATVVQTKRPEYYKQLSIERLHTTSIVRQPSDRRPDVANTSINSTGNTSHNTSELQTSQSLDAETNALDAEKDTKRDRSKSKSAPVSVNRSESYKERLSHKRNRNNRRKTSDPSLSSKPNDDQPDLGLSNSNYTASSNSSLSSGGGSESPSTSMEQVGGPVPIGATTQNTSSNMFSANVVSQAQSLASGHPRTWTDSDGDDDDWSSNITAEVLAALTDAEKKRQEIINEIYQTERSHVRTLKLLEGIFMRPLQECAVLPNDHLHLLFPPALLSLKELHSSFEQKLKMRRIEHNHIVQQVGDLLAGMFDGQSGEELREFAAKFCARQQIALEALKEKRRKDENLQRFLTKAESHKACRRLQLKDLLPTVLQRLTKYPLLFENLYKITKRVVPDDNAEAEAVQRALDSSKRILVDVNQAVKTAEDAHKLQTIQRKLDKSTFDKEEFRNLDLTQLKLIHDGSLTMKKNPGTQLYGLLFDNMVLLLTKQDDKYALKNLQNISTTGTTELNKFISPITYFDQQTLVRQSAVDKNTFFLIITKTSQMLELRAPSSSECKTWFKHISDAAEQYKQRSKSSHEVVEDPASATLPHSNTKESLESTPERLAPSTATATATTTAANITINNNVSDRESTPGVERNRSSLPNNNNSLDIGGGHGGGSRSRSISRNGSRNESNNNDCDSPTAADDAKHLRQQSADEEAAAAASKARRDNSSLYSNNSNNTRTLMQNSPLVEPSAIQISISPAHTAEPVLTPSERLKRLDNSIRENLVEKQKIICDMFRLPIEHFNEIVDIAAQPEAPKDSSDIALAAYAQVQSLTEVLNDYMKINSPEQEISAVSTAVCDQCHQTQQQQHLLKCTQTTGVRSLSPLPFSVASTNTATTVIPNETSSNSPAVPTSPALAIPAVATTAVAFAAATPASNNILTTSTSVDADHVIHEDDDGYCEIDELRLPSVPLSKLPASGSGSSSGGGSGSGTFKTPLPIGVAAEMVSRASTTPELIKRQSTISTDSIPEESEHDMTQLDEPTLSSSMSISKTQSSSKDEGDVQIQQLQQQPQQQQSESNGSIDQSQLENSCSSSLKHRNYADDSLGSEHIEINDTYDTMATLAKLNSLSLNDGNESVGGHHSNSPGLVTCGPNRLLHANSLEPSVPCHLINGIITTLNSQISLLLPKINERDQERERLRRENQHLRELLNAMHERQRVEASMETPAEITKSADTSNETTSTTITAAVEEENKTTTDQPSSPP